MASNVIKRVIPMRTTAIDDDTRRRMQNTDYEHQGFTNAQKAVATDMSQRVIAIPADAEDVDIAMEQLSAQLYVQLQYLDNKLNSINVNLKEFSESEIGLLQTTVNNMLATITSINASISALFSQLTETNAQLTTKEWLLTAGPGVEIDRSTPETPIISAAKTSFFPDKSVILQAGSFLNGGLDSNFTIQATGFLEFYNISAGSGTWGIYEQGFQDNQHKLALVRDGDIAMCPQPVAKNQTFHCYGSFTAGGGVEESGLFYRVYGIKSTTI